ncbi:MAG TPA: sulfotransferase domain-containing protein [Euzebya sp.]|nr:sulfotransferase domain-containing protein [Euzebya sp.]
MKRPAVRWRRALEVAANPPRHVGLRLLRAGRDGPRVLATTIPKAGTHLLMRVLDALPGFAAYHRGLVPLGDSQTAAAAIATVWRRMPAGTHLTSHLPYSPPVAAAVADAGLHVVLLVRDPRDVAASMARFAMTATHVPEHPVYAGLPDDDARLRLAIAGDPDIGQPPLLADRFDRFLPWVEEGALLLRYEDLVGPQGGGSAWSQHDAVARLGGFLGLELPDDVVALVADRVYSTTTHTFRRGRVGGWRDDFTAAHEALFNRVHGDLLDRLGYR